MELFEPSMRPREIRDVNLHVMAVIGLLGLISLAEIPVLLLTYLHAGGAPAAVADNRGQRAHHFAIKARNALACAWADIELDVGHAENNAAKAAFIRRMDVDAIAPGAHGLHAIIALAELEFRPIQ